MPVKRSVIPLHIQYRYIYTWRSSPCFSPLLAPFCSPFVSPSTYLAPSSCDRNRPPQSQVACKLTPFVPPFTQPTPSLQIPRTPTAQRLTKTTSGIFRLLLSGTPCMRDARYMRLISWTLQSGSVQKLPWDMW